ncbi:hypothetical protein F5Y16DRAFT_425167 [Xylariaceae sp. FL0255]|nr:hypothetical protein F5Y16DRAFT_425167 [Xylariaceae sp. FL0255]
MALRSFLAASALIGMTIAAPAPLPTDIVTKVIEGSNPDTYYIEALAARSILNELRGTLGQQKFIDLMEPNTTAADIYWHKIADEYDESKGDHWQRTGAIIQAFVSPTILNATSLEGWIMKTGPGFPNGFVEASPQHWLAYSGPEGVNATIYKNASTVSIETWGYAPGPSITTYFPAYPIAKPSYMPALEEYQSQIVVEMVLRDGLRLATALTAVRVLPDNNSIELYQGMWLRSNTDAWIFTGLQEHLTHEFTNWLHISYAAVLANTIA